MVFRGYCKYILTSYFYPLVIKCHFKPSWVTNLDPLHESTSVQIIYGMMSFFLLLTVMIFYALNFHSTCAKSI